MIRCVCIGCSAVVEAHEDAAGTAIVCVKCGGVIQVPEVSAPRRVAPGATSGRAKPLAAEAVERRPYYVLGGMYGLFVLWLPVALLHSQDGSPLCLLSFGINLALGTGAGFLFLAGMHTPDFLTDWLRMPFTRLRAAVLLLPLMVLGFMVAVHVYSP